MKNKAIATIVVLMFLLSTFAFAPNISRATTPPTPETLSMYTQPVITPSPVTGAGTYNLMDVINATAELTVTQGSTRYVFQEWLLNGSNVTPSASISDGLSWFPCTMYANWNLTAVYQTQYLLTLTSSPFTALGVTYYLNNGTWYATPPTSIWVPSGTTAYVGVQGLTINPTWGDGVLVNPNEWASLANFTVNGVSQSGYQKFGLPTTWWYSYPFTVNGPTSVGSNWNLVYTLFLYTSPTPPPTSSVTGGATGWYAQGTVLHLNATNYYVSSVDRFVFSHWTVDGANVAGNPITVTMNTNHTAIAYYHEQYFIYLDDNLTGPNAGNWYNLGQVYKFTAKTPIPIDNWHRWVFSYWHAVGGGFYNTSNPLYIVFGDGWAGYTLEAYYLMQYSVTVVSSPTVPGFLYPNSNVSNWYTEGAPINCLAKPMVYVPNTNSKEKWQFDDWSYDSTPWTTNNNATGGAVYGNWTFTAYYTVYDYYAYAASPATLTISGQTPWQGSGWVQNDTTLWLGAYKTDDSHIFQFYDWVTTTGTQAAVTWAQGMELINPNATGYINAVAYYANETNLYLTPGVINRNATTGGYCTTFNVTLMAANFNCHRFVNGQSMAIYSMDIYIDFPSNLLQITKVTLDLNQFWPTSLAPQGYFVAKSNVTAGVYYLSAAVKGNYTGFSGTEPIVTLTFHVIYSPTYPEGTISSAITISSWILMNNNGTTGKQIYPEMASGTYYYISAPQPVLDIKDAITGSGYGGNLVTVHTWPSTFNVQVWLLNGIKVNDFHVQVDFNPSMLSVASVAIGTYLQAPYTSYGVTVGSGYVRVYVTQAASVPLQNGTGLLFTITFNVVSGFYWTLGNPTESSVISIDASSLISGTSGLTPSPYTLTPGSINCNFIYAPVIGDLDFNGVVNVLDLQLCAQNYGGPTDCLGPWGTTGIYDLTIVALHYNPTKPAPPNT